MGFSWIRGKTQKLDEKKVKKIHRNTWIGLLLMIATGSVLFWQEHEYLLGRVQFFVKMAFVITLIINGLVLGKIQQVAINYEWENLTFKQRIPLIISGGVSTLAWLGAFAGAFYINQY